jgi:hypothetical protein
VVRNGEFFGLFAFVEEITPTFLEVGGLMFRVRVATET